MFASLHTPEAPHALGAGAAKSPSTLLEVHGVSVSFKGVKALSEVSFKVDGGQIVSLIGPNGAGKTSMLNCVSGRYAPTSGSVRFDGRDITRMQPHQRVRAGLGRTFQNLALFGHMSVLDNILVGRHAQMKNNFITGGLYWWPGVHEEEARHREDVEAIIDFFGINHVRYAQAGSLPYGLRKRVELARALALRPTLLLLDEPMAGMNQEEKEDIARYVLELRSEWKLTILMIEHDMGVVMDISDRVVVLNYGKKIADGLPADVLQDPTVRSAYLGADPQEVQ